MVKGSLQCTLRQVLLEVDDRVLEASPTPVALALQTVAKEGCTKVIPQRPGGQYYSDCSTWPCYGEGVAEAYERACDTRRTLDAGSERCGCFVIRKEEGT